MTKSFAFLVCTVAIAAVSADIAEPWVIVNEDADSTIGEMAEADISPEGLRRHFDETIYGPRLTHYFVNPQAMCACYDSKVADPHWRTEGKPGCNEPTPRWVADLKRLSDAGVDPYRVWMSHARERGVSPWISMRMNDVHFVTDPKPWMMTKMWYERLDLRRNPQGIRNSRTGDADGPFDYSKKEVYDYHLAFFRELVDRYGDVADGIELDWVRFPHHLPLGKEREFSHVLNSFMRDARSYARATEKRLGRNFLVGVRVAATVESAIGLGTDAIAWARDRSVDVITPVNFYNCIEFGATWDDWKRLISKANPAVRLVAGTDSGVEKRGLWRRESMTPEDAAGYFVRAFDAGVDGGISLFNFYGCGPRVPVYKLLVHDGLDSAKAKRMRRNFYLTRRETIADDMDERRPFPCPLDMRREFAIDLPLPNPNDAVIVAPCGDSDIPLEHCLFNGTRPIRFTTKSCEFPSNAVKRGVNIFSVGPIKGVTMEGLQVSFVPAVVKTDG